MVPTWTSVEGSHFVAQGSLLEKGAGGKDEEDDSGAVSVEEVERHEGVEQGVRWRPAQKNKAFGLGLSHEDTGSDGWKKDFGLVCNSAGYLIIWEKGSLVWGPGGSFGEYAAGDELEIKVVGDTVSYHHKGERIHTSTEQPVFPLKVDCGFYGAGAKEEGVCLRRVGM